MLAISLMVPLFAAGAQETTTLGEVVVGSKIDTEGALLGNMMVLLLEDASFAVVDKTQTGTTPIVRSAIIAGEIDIYPEYTGNAYYFFSGETEAAIWKDFQAGYEKAAELDLKANDIVWLAPAPANNTWAISVRQDLAKAQSLATLEDLADYINSGGTFKLAASEEFVSSEAALPSFEAGYGFSLDDDQLLVFAGGNTTLTEQAAASGQEGVNAAMAYGTDGQLAALGLKVLTDTKNIQPVYAPAPIVRRELAEEYPQIATILEPVFATLDLETLQTLNSRIAVQGRSPRDVAREYLEEKGFL
jgi:osmoprotectant transport system substrate-binding protein